MAEQNAVATQQGTQLSVAAQVKSMISQDAVKKKFTEVLGQKAPQFLASITNVVAGSAQLKKCPATTIMSAAFVAATYDLPIVLQRSSQRKDVSGRGNAGCKDNCILRNSEVHQQEEAQGNVGTQDQTNQEAGLG